MSKEIHLKKYVSTGLMIIGLSLMFSIFWQLGLFLWALVVVRFFIKKHQLRWWLVFLPPFVLIPAFSFVNGIVEYTLGKGTLQSVGLPGPEFNNLNKEYRLYHSSSGCVTSGIEVLTHSPNNFAVMTLTDLFGFQNGVYDGKYPSKEEAFIEVGKATPDQKPKIEDDFISFDFGGKIHKIYEGVITDAYFMETLWERKEQVKIKVVRYNEHCLVFDIHPAPYRMYDCVFLYDVKNKSVFAKYLRFNEQEIKTLKDKNS